MKTIEHKRALNFNEVLELEKQGFELVSAVREVSREKEVWKNANGTNMREKLVDIPVTVFYLKRVI